MRGIISCIEPYYKTQLPLHKCEKLEKVREVFQISRRLNHIAQQVTLSHVASLAGLLLC